jgi:hypothetical protein
MKGRRAREPRERSKAGVSEGFIGSGIFAIKTPREPFQFLFDELWGLTTAVATSLKPLKCLLEAFSKACKGLRRTSTRPLKGY